MTDISLTVIPEPSSMDRSVFRQDTPGHPYFRGSRTGVNLVCGDCDFVLVKGLSIEDLDARVGTTSGLPIVLLCPNCGSFNELVGA